jgi:hypothetical protein
MPRYDVTSIERYDYFQFYFEIEAGSPDEAVQIAKEKSKDDRKACDYVGWVETSRVVNSDTSEECEFTPEPESHCDHGTPGTCVNSLKKLFLSIDNWDASMCRWAMRTFNSEERNDVEDNLDFYREHCRLIIGDAFCLDAEITTP